MFRIDETVLLLSPRGDTSANRFKGDAPYWGFGHSFDLYDYEPLTRLFSKVVVYDYLDRMANIPLRSINAELIAMARVERPKYVVWPSVNYEFVETTFDTLRQEGFIVVGIFLDDDFRFDDYSRFWAPHLDFCVTNARETLPFYQALGTYAIYSAGYHGIPIQRDWSVLKEKYEVSFVGARKYNREGYINAIKRHEIPMRVWGPGWGQYIAFSDMIEVFGTSKINLNFSQTEGGKAGWKGRIFQVLNAGGFLLTEYTPGLEDFFLLNRELVSFKDVDEMIDKIQYYLRHDEERRKIARTGWEKATSRYTPFNMMSEIFQEIEAHAGSHRPSFKAVDASSYAFRRQASLYYQHWGITFLKHNLPDLWPDAFSLSIDYDPYNLTCWCCRFLGILPCCIRKWLVHWLSEIRLRLRTSRAKSAAK